MGCCSSSNRIEQVVITKTEKEDLKTKTDHQLTANNELKIITFELETSMEFLISNMLTAHTIIIEFLLYFLDCFNESIQNTFSKGVGRDIDSQALKIIRVALQKLQGLLKNEDNIYQVEEDSSVGTKINKVLQDLELNIKVIVKGNLEVSITKDILKEITPLKEFTLFLAAVFWKENYCKITNSPNFYMKWQEFKEKFLDFSKKYFQIELNERAIENIRKIMDNNEDQRIFYKDFEKFLFNSWLSSKKRKEFLVSSQKETLKKKEFSQQTIYFTLFEFNTTTNKYEKASQINLKVLEQRPSPNNVIYKNLCEEGLTFGINNCDVSMNLQEKEVNYNEKCLIFYKYSSQRYYLSNIAKDVPCKYLLSSKKKINIKPDLLLQVPNNIIKIEKIEDDSCICGLFDYSYNFIREISLTTNNCKEEFTKLGAFESESINLWKENNEWFMNISHKGVCNLDNCIYVIFGTFSELMTSYQAPFRNNIMQGVELENNMILNLNDKIYFVSDGECPENDFSNFTKTIISENKEEKQRKKTSYDSPQKENNHKVAFATNLEEIQIEKNVSTNKKNEAKKAKLNKSRSALLHDQNTIVTSRGQKINIKLVERIQLLEKLFNGDGNPELAIYEEEKENDDNPPLEKHSSTTIKSGTKSRKRSESLSEFDKYVRSPSGKKSIHVNILDRVMLLEKHFRGESIEGFSSMVEQENKQKNEKNSDKDPEEDIFAPNGFAHLTMARPKHPYKHKKRSLFRAKSKANI